MTQADKRFILNVLNYEMADIFAVMGVNTAGGEFVYPEQKDIDQNTKMGILTQLRTNFNLPVDDDYLYEEFGIEKPKDYNQIKAQQENERAQAKLAKNQQPKKEDEDDGDEDENKDDKGNLPKTKKGFKNWLRRFYVSAPQDGGAALDW